MVKRLTYEEVRERIEKEGYILLSTEYINNKQKLEMICPKGHRYIGTWREFQGGCRCSECGGTKKKTFEEVKEYIESQGYILKSTEYINNQTNLDMICPNGHNYSANFNNFKKGYRCKECSGLKEKDIDFIKRCLHDNYNYAYVSGDYKNAHSKLIIKCDKGHEFTTDWNRIRDGRCSCKECNKRYWNVKSVSQYLKEYGFKLVSKEYKNPKTPLRIECCNGHIFDKTLNAFKENKCCPICSSSSGEDRISNILKEMNIDFIFQKTFKECKDKNVLPFDFYISKYNLIIEFDGIQHFKPISKFDGEEGFVTRVLHDAIKNQYCEDNNINILRIPYWDYDNIEKLIKEKINQI